VSYKIKATQERWNLIMDTTFSRCAWLTLFARFLAFLSDLFVGFA